MPADPTAAPTLELGAPGVASWAGIVDNGETSPDLAFPLSLAVFDRMRRTDAQVDAVLRAADLPIRRTGWRIGTDGDGVDDRVRRFVADEVGVDLDRAGAARRRHRRQGVIFRDWLRHALLARPFGFMPFEQVYTVAPPGPGQDALGLPRQAAHLRKLAPRMPRTITGVDVARDGGLIAVRQYVPSLTADRPAGEVTIPADRLVMVVNELEGGDWTGRSVLRSAYRHWIIKDALTRLGPIIAERNGMGVPVVGYPQGGSRDQALKIARGLRAGEDSGLALPEGYTFRIEGVTGSLRDELPLLNYHDQAIGRASLAMVLNLGHDNGARSLGDTFLDLFLMATEATTVDLEDVFTEHVIRDLVELNYGPDEPYPRLIADPITARSAPTAEALKALTEAGLLTPDEALTGDVRRRYGLPAPMMPAGPAAPPTAPPAADLEDDADEDRPDTADLAAGPTPADLALRAATLAERAAALATAAADGA